MLEFPKLALKSLKFVNSIYLLHNICMHDYGGINDVSKRVNISRLNVASLKYRARDFCFFIAKIALNSSAKLP